MRTFRASQFISLALNASHLPFLDNPLIPPNQHQLATGLHPRLRTTDKTRTLNRTVTRWKTDHRQRVQTQTVQDTATEPATCRCSMQRFVYLPCQRAAQRPEMALYFDNSIAAPSCLRLGFICSRYPQYKRKFAPLVLTLNKSVTCIRGR